jgi:hypothetical protein
MLLEALVRRFPALRAFSEATTGGRLTGHLSVAVAQVESENTEMTRAGRRFTGIFSTTGFGTVQAVPTTAATWALYNADANRSYVIDSVTAFFLSGTAAIGGTLLGIVSPLTATLPTAAAGAAVGTASLGGLVSKAVLSGGAPGYTIPAPAGMVQWFSLPGQQGQSSGVAPGLGGNYIADVRGRVIVPPGKVLGLALVTNVGTSPLFIMGATWHEAELDLE